MMGKKSNYRLNHSRHLDYYAMDVGNEAYNRAKETPTAKQVKFYKRLYAICRENNIDPKTGEYTRTRMDYAMAIDTLIKRLQEAGIDVSGNGNKADYVIKAGEDRRGRLYVGEKIEIWEERANE